MFKASFEISITNGLLFTGIDTIIFLQKWLENNADQILRHDYHELSSLSLLVLGNIALDPKYLKVKAPGAIHNAPWMSKALYTIKIAVHRNQLQEVYLQEKLLEIASFAAFLVLFYTETWLTCTRAGDFPPNDLNFFKKLTKTEDNIKKNPTVWPPNFLSFVEGARKKFENHLCCLSERLVPLTLYSDNLDLTQKNNNLGRL